MPQAEAGVAVRGSEPCPTRGGQALHQRLLLALIWLSNWRTSPLSAQRRADALRSDTRLRPACHANGLLFEVQHQYSISCVRLDAAARFDGNNAPRKSNA